jgi:hypothetical protein
MIIFLEKSWLRKYIFYIKNIQHSKKLCTVIAFIDSDLLP